MYPELERFQKFSNSHRLICEISKKLLSGLIVPVRVRTRILGELPIWARPSGRKGRVLYAGRADNRDLHPSLAARRFPSAQRSVRGSPVKGHS